MGSRRILTGTIAGQRRCAACGHARVRHYTEGSPGCSHVSLVTIGTPGRPTSTIPRRCDCGGFTTRKDS